MSSIPVRILAVGRDSDILQIVKRLIDAHGNWSAVAETIDEAAIAAFEKERFDIVFVCAGVTTEEEESLRQRFLQLDPKSIVLRHYGGGSGLLENEVRLIIDKKLVK